MKKGSFFKSLPFKLLVAVILGILSGLVLNRYSTNGISMAVLNIVVTVKYILGQIITFCVPLIVLGFIAPSITKLGKNASVMLGVAVVLAYGSSIGAALFSTASGFFYYSASVHSFLCGRAETAAGSNLRTGDPADHVGYECSCFFCHDRPGCHLDKSETSHRSFG